MKGINLIQTLIAITSSYIVFHNPLLKFTRFVESKIFNMNPLMPGGGLFKYVWPICHHQILKS